MIKYISIGYMTASEAAEYLGIDRPKFYNWGHLGLLPEPALAYPGVLTLWSLKDIEKVKKLIGGEPYLGKRELKKRQKAAGGGVKTKKR
jgi:hypothetical protein